MHIHTELIAKLDAYQDNLRDQRKMSQMTLGGLLTRLDQLKREDVWEMGRWINICNPHSYRGYYADIAFETSTETRLTIDNAIALVRGCIDQSFTGYKGGSYRMGPDAPVWIAHWGCCGAKLVSVDLNSDQSEICSLNTAFEEDFF